jgi:hypothetical protein
MAERDRVARVRQGAPRPPAGATEPAVKVLGPIRDERPDAPDEAPAAPEPPAAPTPHTLPLIEDASVASGSLPWAPPDGAERKPLLTRAQPLDSRGVATTWALRLAALLVLVVVVVLLVALL